MITLTCPHGAVASGDLTPEQAVNAIHLVCSRCAGKQRPSTRMVERDAEHVTPLAIVDTPERAS